MDHLAQHIRTDIRIGLNTGTCQVIENRVRPTRTCDARYCEVAHVVNSAATSKIWATNCLSLRVAIADVNEVGPLPHSHDTAAGVKGDGVKTGRVAHPFRVLLYALPLLRGAPSFRVCCERVGGNAVDRNPNFSARRD